MLNPGKAKLIEDVELQEEAVYFGETKVDPSMQPDAEASRLLPHPPTFEEESRSIAG